MTRSIRFPSAVHARNGSQVRRWGPLRYISTRNRRGTEMSVGGCGCCLPIPLLAVLVSAAVFRALMRRAR